MDIRWRKLLSLKVKSSRRFRKNWISGTEAIKAAAYNAYSGGQALWSDGELLLCEEVLYCFWQLDLFYCSPDGQPGLRNTSSRCLIMLLSSDSTSSKRASRDGKQLKASGRWRKCLGRQAVRRYSSSAPWRISLMSSSPLEVHIPTLTSPFDSSRSRAEKMRQAESSFAFPTDGTMLSARTPSKTISGSITMTRSGTSSLQQKQNLLLSVGGTHYGWSPSPISSRLLSMASFCLIIKTLVSKRARSAYGQRPIV